MPRLNELFELLRSTCVPDVVRGLQRAIAIAKEDETALSLAQLVCGQLDVLATTLSNGDGIGLARDGIRANAGANRLEKRFSEGECSVSLPTLRRLLFQHRVGLRKLSSSEFLHVILADQKLFDSSEVDPVLRPLFERAIRELGLVVPTASMSSDAALESEVEPGLGRDLVAEAQSGRWSECPLVGQRQLLEQLLVVVDAGFQAPLLLGEAGVGKTAIVEGLAYHIAHNPEFILIGEQRDWRILEISVADLLSDTAHQGKLETKLQELLRQSHLDRNIILFFDEIHAVLDRTEESSRRIADILKPALGRGLRCIGATTKMEFDKHIASDAALVDRFQPIVVNEPNREQAIEILRRAKSTLLGSRGIELELDIAHDAFEAAVDLSIRFQPTRRLPRKAWQVTRLAVQQRIGELTRLPDKPTPCPAVNRRDIAQVFATYRKVPVDFILNPTGEQRFSQMRKEIISRLRGQDHAVDAVLEQVRLHAKGWAAPRRPIGVFLFLGPPGVGKSELGKLLAKFALTEPGEPIVQDMNVFGGNQEMAIAQFIGTSAGFVGYGDSTVFSRVRSQPHCVLILDEIEKAPRLFPVLLSVFMGSAEDARHIPTDFSQSVIIMTSNALRNSWGSNDLTEEELRDRLVQPDATDAITPFTDEFIDRVDRVICFQGLDRSTLAEILAIQIADREKQAALPLPGLLKSDDVLRNQFLDELCHSSRGSARELSRKLDVYIRGQLGRTRDYEPETDYLKQSD
jgi:ATP-dependent Clp protease ATP-binding subunit ClpA